MIESKAWHSGTARPAMLANVGVVAVGEKLLAPGGCDVNGTPHKVTHLYDPASDVWTEGALPQYCARMRWRGVTGRHIFSAVGTAWHIRP